MFFADFVVNPDLHCQDLLLGQAQRVGPRARTAQGSRYQHRRRHLAAQPSGETLMLRSRVL